MKRTILAAAALALAFIAGAATVALSPIKASADAPLEPSIQNEVDHAIALAERALDKAEKAEREAASAAGNVAPAPETREETALRLITTQRGDGTWPGDVILTTRRNLETLRQL